MEAVFLKLVNLSLAAGWFVLAVAALRLLFRKAPRWVSCLLWGLVAVRLMLPFSIESSLSLIPSARPLPQEIIYTAQPQIESGIAAVDNLVNPVLEASLTPAEFTSANPTQVWSFILSRLWVIGSAVMLFYAAVSAIRLKRKLTAATLMQKGIRRSEFISSPFIFGVLRPTIYLPYSVAESDVAAVLAHERAHIQRKDHLWKPLGFILLSVYWFHPLMWLAYVLFCRDMETACDEKVIRQMDPDGRRAYSSALLNCSIRRGSVAACPLAFGEVGVKARIKGIMNYKKPAFWVTLAAAAVCVAMAVCFLTVPKQQKEYPKWDCTTVSAGEFVTVFSGEEITSSTGVLTFQNRNLFPVEIELRGGETKLIREIQPGGVLTFKQAEKDCIYTIGMSAEAAEGKEIRIVVYDGDRADAYSLFPETETPNVERPMLQMDGAFYVDPYKPETVLPAGFSPAGQLTEEQAYNTGLAGTDYFTNPDLPGEFYTYQICGTAVAVDEVDSEQRQWAYLRWIPVKLEALENKRLTLDDIVFLSEKGNDLTWDDFDGYQYTETGSGLLIRLYPVDERYGLSVGGAPGKKLSYILLSDGINGASIDIRTEDVKAFLS